MTTDPSGRGMIPMGTMRRLPVFAPVVPRIATAPDRAIIRPPMMLNVRWAQFIERHLLLS